MRVRLVRYNFAVLLELHREEPNRDDVRAPALPGCLTYGESADNVLSNAREAITLDEEGLIADGVPVPIAEHAIIATSVSVTPDAAA